MNKLKLKPKQLAVLQDVTQQKAQLSKAFQELNQKETLILELIFEENGVQGTITSVKLEQDNLLYELAPAKELKEKKQKAKKTEPQPTQ